jgi:DNA-binding FrmR family transcriptional regulator
MHRFQNNSDGSNMDKKVLISLKKASSNIRKVLMMLEEKRPPIDLLQMNAAILGLLRSVQRRIIQSYVEERLKSASQLKKSKLSKKLLEEIIELVKSYDK